VIGFLGGEEFTSSSGWNILFQSVFEACCSKLLKTKEAAVSSF
jgi:hypothetical protein